jgi:restriction system protein
MPQPRGAEPCQLDQHDSRCESSAPFRYDSWNNRGRRSVARRKRQSTAEDVVGLVARLPWWAGLSMALVSFLLLHWLAGRQAPIIRNPGQVGDVLPYMMLAGISRALQFVIPPLCIVAAAISLVRRKKREELVANVTQSASAESLNGMSWREFEHLVGEAFRLQGYEVQEQGGAQPDGGVDLVLRRGREIFLVQCKQWKAMKVGVDVVRELYGVMAARGAAGGFVVTSGRFTEDATEFATGRNVRLVDGAAAGENFCFGEPTASRSGECRTSRAFTVAGGAGVSQVQRAHGAPHGETGHSSRLAVLGMLCVSGLSGNPVIAISPSYPSARSLC